MSLSDDKQVIIPAFFFRKKGYINFVPKSVRRPSVRACVRASVRHVSCKCITSQTVRRSNFKLCT